MNLETLSRQVEALIFSAAAPVPNIELKMCLSVFAGQEISDGLIDNALAFLVQKYDTESYSFFLKQTGGGWQFLTNPAYENLVQQWLKLHSRKRLSPTALETIAIIAYKQPITKGQIEKIRGVNSDYAVQKLLEKELIAVCGKADTVGYPILYGTSDKFMDYFGINSLKEMPQPKDFADDATQIGNEEK